MLPWQGTKQSIRDRIGNNVDVYGYGNKRCVCCFFPAVHPAPVQPPPDLLNAVLARVATEKRVSLVKAWEESERSKAENKPFPNISWAILTTSTSLPCSISSSSSSLH
ncbi:uncharacterized protein LOC107648801 isoform X2 [Arachis ipaensis]|uniref:uncharacterized protein LOC107648801 isoform X2 n=1 Tax=Arachis ipaensis TaxID=130454 RepID=UPI000A2B4A7A|nr:uncharacterized protein LOC107648801 isoform X2 [Arachis ipaensis]